MVDSNLLKQIRILTTEQELIIDEVNQLQQNNYEVPEMLRIDDSKEPLTDISEIKKLLGKDKTKSKINLNDYLGIVSSPKPTNSLQEKKESYTRG